MTRTKKGFARTLMVMAAIMMVVGVAAVGGFVMPKNSGMTVHAAALTGPTTGSTWTINTVTAEDGNGTDASGIGTWDWVQSTKTLTLTNFNHTATGTALRGIDFTPAASAVTATIILSGDNSITATGSSGASGTSAIRVGDSTNTLTRLTIKGNGTLTLTTNAGTGGPRYGINCGLGAGRITVEENATVTATSVTGSTFSYGIFASDVTLNDNAQVTAKGGTVTGSNPSAGISSGSSGSRTITINNNASLTAEGGSGSDSVYGVSNYTTITMNGGCLQASGATRAISSDYTVPGGLKYWTNTNANGTSGTADSGVGNDTFAIDSTHKWAQINPMPVSFTAEQTGGTSGTADSTDITITFNKSVSGLAATDISIDDDTGSATKGALSGSGTTYTIALDSVTTQGDVTVTIADFGMFNVTTTPQTVAVYTRTAVTFTAVQTGGTHDTTDSTGIILTFDQAVTGLTAGDITITDGTGSAVKGSLSGTDGGDTYTIALSSVATQGNVTVSIADFDMFIVSGSKSVAVYKDTRSSLTFTAVQTGGTSNTADSTGIVLTFNTFLATLSASDITITDDTGVVTVGSLFGSGTVWTIALTAIAAQGNITVGVADFGAFRVDTEEQIVAVYKDATVYTNVTFTAEQTGGTSGTANSTGIVITFDVAVAGLTAGDITIEDGTGEVVKGTLSSTSATVWTIALDSVTTQGSVTVKIANFGTFIVDTVSQSVAVYKDTRETPTAADLTFTIPTNHVYNGAEQGFDVTKATAAIGTITVKYNGSTTVPTDAGEYTVTVEVAENGAYLAATITIGIYTIAKAIASTPTGLTAIVGDTLESIELPEGWSWDDVLTTSVGAAGTRTFTASFTHPTDTANNETLDEIVITITVSKAAGSTTVPSAPTEASKTKNSITITAVAGSNMEYAISTTNTAPATGWQTGLTFENLDANTTYYVFAREAGDANTEPGVASVAATITTEKEPDNDFPLALVLGIVGGIVALGAIGAAVYFFVIRRKKAA